MTNFSMGVSSTSYYQYHSYPIETGYVRLEGGRGKTNVPPVRSLSTYIGGCLSEARCGQRFWSGSNVRSDVDRNNECVYFCGSNGEATLIMRNFLLSLTGGLCLAFTASATTVEFQLSPTATPNEYTYLFTTNAQLLINQALVVTFPFPGFTNLRNEAIGGVGFTLVLHQPDNPLGANGDMTILTGTAQAVPGFQVDATFPTGVLPSTLPFQILQFDGSSSTANVVGGPLETGTATLLVSGVPEPSSAMMSLVGISMVGGFLAVRRR